MTYNVFGGTLNPTLLLCCHHHTTTLIFVLKVKIAHFDMHHAVSEINCLLHSIILWFFVRIGPIRFLAGCRKRRLNQNVHY